ncbi:MAG: BspA family leucine-rich repeat surface protein [Ruminococcus sp.]|nr:BspA family leucine-rich repeat surface protein [Ruminococcus sp.]
MKRSKRVAASLLALAVTVGAFGLAAPAKDTAVIGVFASETEPEPASTVSYDEETGTLTLLAGELNASDVFSNKYKEGIKKVVVQEGCVFPENCASLFAGCPAEEFDMSGADTSKVTDMYQMFAECENVKNLDLTSFDTSNVTNMSEMIDWCESLESVDVSSFDTSKNTNFRYMFGGNETLKKLDISNFDFSSAENLIGVCGDINGLEEVKLPTTTVPATAAAKCYYMFDSDWALKELDLSTLTFAEGVDVEDNLEDMFYGTYSLRKLTINDSLKITPEKYLRNIIEDEPYLGWIVEGDEEHTIVSGIMGYAEFSGANTYIRYKPMDKHEGTPATCENKGTKDYWTDPAEKAPVERPAEPLADTDTASETGETSETGEATEFKPTMYSDEYGIYEVEDANGDGVVDENDLVIEALGHSWGDWTVTKEATLDAEGEEQRVCANDPTHIETRAIPKLEPVPDPAPEPSPEPQPDNNPKTGAYAGTFAAAAVAAGAVILSKKRRK